MIIKYYYNGWNYIDNAEEVRWINKQITYDHMDKDCVLMSYPGELYIPNGYDGTISERIIGDVEYQLEYYNDENWSKLSVRIEDECYKSIQKREIAPYIRIICYTANDVRRVLIFSGAGYLLNDNGQTIERMK